MKIVFVGCVQFSYATLRKLLSLPVKEVEVIGVVTRRHSTFHADFCSLEPLAKEHGIPCCIVDELSKDAMEQWIASRQPDVIYCFGWSSLLSQNLLNIPPMGVIGYHPAALPQNRGRHPIIWALALGLTETASTFFFMDEGADSGDILHQRKVPIAPEDDAATLYKKLTDVALHQVEEFTLQLLQGTYTRTPQDHQAANYWRKRTKKDGEIDWRMSAESIHNLVRALTKPYVGAHCLFRDQEVKIWRTEVADGKGLDNIEPGKVLKVEASNVYVKCGAGVIKLCEHEFPTLPEEGSYL